MLDTRVRTSEDRFCYVNLRINFFFLDIPWCALDQIWIWSCQFTPFNTKVLTSLHFGQIYKTTTSKLLTRFLIKRTKLLIKRESEKEKAWKFKVLKNFVELNSNLSTRKFVWNAWGYLQRLQFWWQQKIFEI